jgi:hypothetical protein
MNPNVQGAPISLQRKSRIDRTTISGGKFGTALQAASFQGKLDIAELLLVKGANPNLQG